MADRWEGAADAKLDMIELGHLETFARRGMPWPRGQVHQYDSKCPWCRASKSDRETTGVAMWQRGGSHEWALALLREIDRLHVANSKLAHALDHWEPGRAQELQGDG